MVGVVWATSQFLGTQPLLLVVSIDVGQVFFPLTGTIPVRPGDLLRLVISVGFLGGCPFFGAHVTALVIGGRCFLLCFPLFGFLLGCVALAGSRGGVAVGVVPLEGTSQLALSPCLFRDDPLLSLMPMNLANVAEVLGLNIVLGFAGMSGVLAFEAP